MLNNQGHEGPSVPDQLVEPTLPYAALTQALKRGAAAIAAAVELSSHNGEVASKIKRERDRLFAQWLDIIEREG